MNHRSAVRVFVAAAIATLLATSGVVADDKDDEKQEQVARSFSELSNHVSLGDTVFVTDESGRTSKATVTQFAPTQLHLMQKGAEVVLSEDGVQSIDVRYSDSLINGAVIGGLVGAAVILPFALEDDFAARPVDIPVMAAIGAGIGLGVDALIKGRKRAYTSPSVQGTQVRVYPILSRDRTGVRVAVSF